MGTSVTAITINSSDLETLGNYGVAKMLNVNNENLKTFNAKAYAGTIAQAAEKEGASAIIVNIRGCSAAGQAAGP